MKHGNSIYKFILFIFLSCFCFAAKPQNLDELYNLLESKTKEIDKAMKDISEAGKLTQEANNYYNEASELQSNYDLDEKTLQKQLSKAEDKALSLQMEADKLYSGAYKSLNKLCIDEINSSGVSYGESDPFVSTANELMNQAVEKRKQAANTRNPYEKAVFLNDAAGLEATAIENLIAALQVQKGVSPQITQQSEPEEDYKPEPSITGTGSAYTPQELREIPSYYPSIEQKSENLAIDQSVVAKYQQYVNDSTIPDPITINRSGVSGVTDVSIDNARDIFLRMHQGNVEFYQPVAALINEEQQQAVSDTISDITRTSPGVSEQLVTERLTTTGREDKSAQQTGVTSDKKKKTQVQKPAERKTTEIRQSTDISYTQQSSGVRFMVQIAASRAPLTRSQLWAIYPGNNSVEVVQEGGWYKYRIGNFRTFTEANRVALESGVKSAWVLSMHDNDPINLAEAREMTRVLESDVQRYGSKVIKEGIDFYVQLAASKTRMTDLQRTSLCGSPQACREVVENGWFKYQVYAGTDYQQAVDLKNSITRNSFIVAYERGMKLKLRDAKNK